MKSVDSLLNVISFPESDLKTRVPDHEYKLKFIGYSTDMMFEKAAKLTIVFEIISFGEHFGKRICRYYNVAKLLRGGRFKAKQTGSFAIEYAKLFPDQQITRLDRIPMERFKNVEIVGVTRTVTEVNRAKTSGSPAKQVELPEQLRYSVVAELIRVEL